MPVVIHQPVAVLPDDALLADCPVAAYSDVGGALAALGATVECERGRNAALRAWKAKAQGPRQPLG